MYLYYLLSNQGTLQKYINTKYSIPVSYLSREGIDSGTSVDHKVAPVHGFAAQ